MAINKFEIHSGHRAQGRSYIKQLYKQNKFAKCINISFAVKNKSFSLKERLKFLLKTSLKLFHTKVTPTLHRVYGKGEVKL